MRTSQKGEGKAEFVEFWKHAEESGPQHHMLLCTVQWVQQREATGDVRW